MARKIVKTERNRWRRCPFATALLILLSSCAEEKGISTDSPEALRFYTKGVTLVDQFYYAEGKAYLDSALVYDSTFAMAWARLAALSYDNRNEESALSSIRKAKRLSGKASEREKFFIRLWEHMIRFSHEDAIATADSFITEYPDEKEVCIILGRLYEESSKLDSAILMYQNALELDTAYARAEMSLGYAYSSGRNQEKALDHMQRYIRLAPGLADPRASYADLLMRVGRYDEALEQYNASLEIKPDYWYSVNQIGSIYSILGRLKEAETQYSLGLATLPQGEAIDVLRLSMLAQLDLNRGDYSGAAKGYLAALDLDSASLEASYGLSITLAKMGRSESADSLCKVIRAELERKGLTNSPWMVGYLLMRSRALIERGELAEARASCEEALDRATPIGRGSIFRQLAEISLKFGEFDRGFLECEESLTINPNAPLTLLTLVQLYRASGDSALAGEIGNRLLELWKDADPDFIHLQELRQTLSRRSPA
jgi:tetratricopeptide (TPR) repeat protein